MPKVTLLAHTPEPEQLVAAAAKLCYSSQSAEGLLEELTPEKTSAFIELLMSLGHESPVEHVSFTFAIEGVSRSLLAQLTRHRIASYSVQSQRYVKLDGPACITPPEIADCPEASALYEQAMAASISYYEQIAQILKEKHYQTLLQSGMNEKAAASAAEKKAIEDARFVLPNACETKLVVTMNCRSLYNFFRHRCCTRAQWEIRELADEMLFAVKKVAPKLFLHAGPPCVDGPCPEGKMCCGQMTQMRTKYKGGSL